MTLPCPFGKAHVDLSGKTISVEQKMWFVEQMQTGKSSVGVLAKRFNIKVSTLRSWKWRAEHNGALHNRDGRPNQVSPAIKKSLKTIIGSSPYQIADHEVQNLMQKLREEEAEHRGMASASVEQISRRTYKRYRDEIGIVVKNAELTTDARIKAMSSVRNALSYYALSAYATKELAVPPPKMLNSDGSSFTVGATNKDATKVAVLKVERGNGSPMDNTVNQTVASKGESIFGLYTIKVYVTINGNGNIMDVVYIIQDEDMKEEDCFIHPVAGLGATASITSQGYIVFMKSRAGNESFYRWVCTSLIPNAVSQIDAAFPELADRPAFWKLDGEPIQLKPFKEADVQAKLRDNNIHVAKSPHSCTAIFQECDAGNLFKAAKTVNRKLKTKYILDSIVKDRVKNIFAIHDATMNPMRESTNTLAPTKKKTKKGTANRKTGKKRTKKPKGLTTYHKNLAINGIMRVQQSLQATVRPQIIRESYVICGTIPLSLDQMLNQLRGSIVDMAERCHLRLLGDELVNIIASFGEISESAFDDMAVREDAHYKQGHKRRDERVIYQRRALLLTHPVVMDKEWNLDDLPPPSVVVIEETPTDGKRQRVLPKRYLD